LGEAEESDLMKRILIINITRMGDLLQTTPLIRGLKRKYPNAELTMLVLESNRRLCAGFDGVDRIISFDAEEYISRLQDDNHSLEDNHLKLKRFIKRAGGDYDLIINLSHTTLSGALVKLIGGEDIRGMVMTDWGRFIVRHPWMNYFFYVTAHRHYNTFNLVDMYNLTGEVDLRARRLQYNIPAELKDYPSEILDGGGNGYVGFQLGASSESRRWPPQYFGELANIIRRKFGYKIIVFGTNSERKLLDELRKTYQGVIIDLMGKTTVPQLAALLTKCQYLITNDTGTMHLAAAVGTPVIAMFLGEARCSDTGPYTEEALILEANIACAPCEYNSKCQHYECRECILPDNVIMAMDKFRELTSSKVKQLDDSPQFAKIRLYRPVFEDYGLLNIVPLIKRPLTFEDFLKITYRRMWKSLLLNEDKFKTDYLALYLPPDSEQMLRQLKDFLELMERISALGHRGLDLIEKIGYQAPFQFKDKREIKFLLKLLTMLDSMLWQYEWNYEATHPVTKSMRLLIRNLASSDPEYVMKLTYEMYVRAKEGSKVVVKEVEEYLKKSEYHRKSELINS